MGKTVPFLVMLPEVSTRNWPSGILTELLERLELLGAMLELLGATLELLGAMLELLRGTLELLGVTLELG